MPKEKSETVNEKYKDRLLNFIFGSEENKEWTLSLYNAINHSNYTDKDAIEFNTIKEVLYLGMHNDTSFLISDTMQIYEHQSTYNPNMPLRQLQYLSNLYEGYIKKNNLSKYSSTLISLPIPKMVVLYNGKRNVDDDTILKLSDSFNEEHRDEADVEVRVRMININYGHNKELLGACKPLQEYSWFIEKVRDYYEDYTLEDSVEMAIREMPDDFLIKQFIVINKAEVCKMLLTEYDEAEAQELFKNEGRDEGSTKRLIELICKKLEKGKSIETIADEVEETVESIKPICNIAEKHAPDYDVDAIYDELRNKK